MPVSGLHRQIAALALAAAGEHGFALGGGNVLLAHGVISRPTQDVGLFTGQEHGVQAAAGFVEAALRGAGSGPERQDQAAGLTGIFPGMGEGLAEWIVTAPGGEQAALHLACSGPGPRAGDHRHRPGPGPGRRRGREGVRAGQPHRAAGLRGRGRCAAALGSGPVDSACPAAGSGLAGRDFADTGLRLDQMKDARFAGVGLSQADVTALRERFAGWPRDAGASGRQLQAGNAAEPQPGPGHSPSRSGREPGEDDPDPAGPQQRPGHDRDAEAGRADPEAEP